MRDRMPPGSGTKIFDHMQFHLESSTGTVLHSSVFHIKLTIKVISSATRCLTRFSEAHINADRAAFCSLFAVLVVDNERCIYVQRDVM